MLHIKQTQFKILDQAAKNRFYSSLDIYLDNHFLEYDQVQRLKLNTECRKSCEELKIFNEDGIFAFHVLSFMVGGSLQGSPDYQLAHRRYILLGHDAGQLPIDLLYELTK